MPELAVNPMRDFLLMTFQEDKSQRPEFSLEFKEDGTGGPFSALRRREMVQLANKYGIELNPNQPATSMVPVLNTAWIQGKFPQPKDMAAENFVNQLTPEVMELLRARMNAGEQPSASGENAAVPKYDDETEYPYAKLKSLASAKGINTHGMKRQEIEDALYQAEVP